MTLRDALDFALTSLRGNLAKSLLTVLGLNLLGDGLRDALDPRLRRRSEP